MGHEKLLAKDGRIIMDGILDVLRTPFEERTYKRHFNVGSSGSIIEDSARYACKKLGLDEKSWLDEIVDNIVIEKVGVLKRAKWLLDDVSTAMLVMTLSHYPGRPFDPAYVLFFYDSRSFDRIPRFNNVDGKIYVPSLHLNHFSLTHEPCHLVGNRIGVDSLQSQSEFEGLATCVSVDAQYDLDPDISKVLNLDKKLISYGYHEIADAMHVPENTIRGNLSNAGIPKKDLDKLFNEGVSSYVRPYSIGYSILNALALLNGEEKAYTSCLRNGFPGKAVF